MSETTPMTQSTHVRGTIKPLVWREGFGAAGNLIYRIAPPSHTIGWRVWVTFADKTASIGGVLITARADGEEAAKSAAQADYEARILAQIEPDTNSNEADHYRKKWLEQLARANTAEAALCASKPALSDTDAPQEECTICGRKGCSAETCFDAPSRETGELLPCPFCGSLRIDASGYQVICNSCGSGTSVEDSLDDAITAWNLRDLPAASSEAGELVSRDEVWKAVRNVICETDLMECDGDKLCDIIEQSIRGLPSARAEFSVADAETEKLIAWLLENDAGQIKLVDDFPHRCGLVKPLNDPCTGDMLEVAALEVEDSGYAPALWKLALAVLQQRRALTEAGQ